MAERPIAEQYGYDGEELLAALLESMVDAVYAVDQTGAVLFANRAALGVLGYDSEGELLGRNSHATIHFKRPDGLPFPEAECPLLRPRTTGEAVRVEQDWFVRKDDTFVPVTYSSAPVTVNGRRGAVVVFRDLSERDRAEAERRRADAIHASARAHRAGGTRRAIALSTARPRGYRSRRPRGSRGGVSAGAELPPWSTVSTASTRRCSSASPPRGGKIRPCPAAEPSTPRILLRRTASSKLGPVDQRAAAARVIAERRAAEGASTSLAA